MMENKTMEQWREELHRLKDCKSALEGAPLSNAYNSPNSYENVNVLLNRIAAEHGIDRVKLVLAHTVREYSWDGRYCTVVKNWAANVEPFENPTNGRPNSEQPNRQRFELAINQHPAILNEVARLVIKREKQLAEPTPSKVTPERSR